MNKELFKKALKSYRIDEEFFEEIEIVESKQYQFMDTECGNIYPLNNVDEVSFTDFFVDSNNNEEYEGLTHISKFVDLKKLKNILNRVDKKSLFFLNEVVVILEEDDIEVVEDCIGRELLEDTLGQSTGDTNSIIVNMNAIFEGFNEQSMDAESFFKDCVYQFYLTLFHELGHVCLRDNLLDIPMSNYCPFDYPMGVDHEDIVEEFAETTFEELDFTCNVFEPFNMEYITNKFKC